MWQTRQLFFQTLFLQMFAAFATGTVKWNILTSAVQMELESNPLLIYLSKLLLIPLSRERSCILVIDHTNLDSDCKVSTT